jgi:hypothetical protein
MYILEVINLERRGDHMGVLGVVGRMLLKWS